MLIRQVSTVALAAVLVASVAGAGQTGTKRSAPDEYTGTTANLTPGSDNPISIQVLKWSSKADRERVLSAIRSVSKEEGRQQDLTRQLAEVPTAGYIWTGGPVGYAIKYACRVSQPDSGEHIVLVTDRPLGILERSGSWKATGQESEADPFTIVELHLNKSGTGNNKMSLGVPFSVNDAEQTLSLSNYEHAAVMLGEIEHKPKPYWAKVQ